MTSLERPQPRARRGLVDVTLMLLLLYAVYAKTPCGALPVWVYRKAMDQPTPDLLATFQGRETSVQLGAGDLNAGLLASTPRPPAVEDAAKRTGADPALLVSYLSATEAPCRDAACEVPAPPLLGQLLDDFSGRERVPLLELATGLARAARELDGDPKLALEALYLGTATVQRAVAQARVTGLEDPAFVEVHAAFLSPSMRRGPLQAALRVLAHHRLHTIAWPADKKWRISSPFGDRIHPVLGTRRLHNGTDIAGPTGAPLFSLHDGRISRRGRDSVNGNFIKVHVGFGIEATYCHLSRVDVTSGQRVARAETVGAIGATGRVTGPHLHYILRIDGRAVDPERYGDAPVRAR